MEILDKCPVCYSQDFHIFFGSVLAEDVNELMNGTEFALCHNCSAAFRVSRLTNEENIEWYRSGDYRVRTALHAEVKDELRHQQMRAENIAALVNNRYITSHLDIGCSAGLLLKEIQKTHSGIRSIGVDVDPKFTQYATDLQIIPTIDDVSGLFDLITIIHTLEHISEPQPFLAKVVKCLSPGGILIIEVPNRRVWMVAYAAPEHVIAYDRDSLGYLMDLFGLKIGATLYQGHIQGSPLDLNVIILATNDPNNLIPKRNLPEVRTGPLKVFVHIEKEQKK
jgi:SAM-dependent methyltransferase